MTRTTGLAIAALLFWAPFSSAQAPPSFTSGVDVVHLGVSVMDDGERPVSDLAAADFELYEDGVLQTVQYFSRGLHSDRTTMPLHIGVLFDVSGSMTRDGRFAKTAAIRFLNTLTYAEDVTLVDFDGEVRMGRFTQADFPRLVERIRGQQAAGWTAFYDALGLYLHGAVVQDGRKVLVMYSDGEDTRSRQKFSDTLELVRASDVTVYAIGFMQFPMSNRGTLHRARLRKLAEVSGGRCFFPNNVRKLEAIYREIAAEFETRYSLGYVSTNARMDGAWREVEVRLRPGRADLRRAVVRSREGYYAPYRESDAAGGR